MSKKIKLGILGGGSDSLIGIVHRVASAMYDHYELVGGVFNPDLSESIKFAEEIGMATDRVYRDLDQLVAEENKLPKEERIQIVSVLTPNFLHFPMAKKLLDNGFHVICEKPMTTTYEEAKILYEAQQDGAVYIHHIVGIQIVQVGKDLLHLHSCEVFYHVVAVGADVSHAAADA